MGEPKSPGGPFEFFIAMGGFVGGEGGLFGTFQGGAAHPEKNGSFGFHGLSKKLFNALVDRG